MDCQLTRFGLIYVFGLMTCEDYYQHHPDPNTSDKCKISSIESSWARSFAILGMCRSLFGGISLFTTSWCIKRFGIKKTLLASCILPAMSLLIQNVGIETGARQGILIVQCSQIITIFGGPFGYILALNSYITEIILSKERTATLGRITGLQFFGTAIGYLAGGWLSDLVSHIAAFRVALALFCISSTYVAFALPQLPSNLSPAQRKRTNSISAFFEPLLVFVPKRWQLQNGWVQKEYGVLILGIAAFLGVLATGYIEVLLQLFATDVFDFSATDNAYLVALSDSVRATFLTFAFPVIIDRGRRWLAKRNQHQRATQALKTQGTSDHFVEVIADREPEQPVEVDDHEESFQFDLLYARWTLLADTVFTCLAAFVSKSWHLYIVAIILPLASGTGSSARGAMLSMTSPAQKDDALSAISLVELGAELATTGVFGGIFAAFTEAGKSNLTFVANAAVALVSFLVFCIARFPPDGAQRIEEATEDEI